MAKRFLTDLLNPADQADVGNAIQSVAPYQNELWDAFENADQSQINAVLAKAKLTDGGDKIRNVLFSALKKVPTRDVAYQNYAGSIKDEGKATDEELQNKIAALQGLSKTGVPIDKASIDRWIDQKTGYGEGTLTIVKPYISDFVVNNRRLPDTRELLDIMQKNAATINGDPSAIVASGSVQNLLSDQNNKNYIAQTLGGQPQDYTADIQRIQDILDTRTTEGNKTAAITNFLKTTPEELAAARGGFYKQQQSSNARYLNTRLAPQIVSNLNARGLAEGPDVASSIAAAGTELQSSLEDKIRSMEASDNQFFADAAFRLTQAKLNASEDQLNQQIAYERASVRQKQDASFRSRETDIVNEFDLEQLRREQERELSLGNADIDFQKSERSSRLISGLGADIGRSVGQTVATKVVTSPSPSLKDQPIG